MIKKIFQKNNISINSNIDFFRDYIGISYLIKVIELLLNKNLDNKIINVSSENSLSILDLAKIIKKKYKKKFQKQITIFEKIKKKDKKFKIESAYINKKIKKKAKYYFERDLTELLQFCKKNFKYSN